MPLEHRIPRALAEVYPRSGAHPRVVLRRVGFVVIDAEAGVGGVVLRQCAAEVIRSFGKGGAASRAKVYAGWVGDLGVVLGIEDFVVICCGWVRLISP